MLSFSSVSSSSGNGSAVEQLVAQSIAQERKPIDTLEGTKVDINRKISVYTDLKAKLKVLQDRLKKFSEVGSAEKLGAKIASSSNTKVFTAEASGDASVGSSTIFVSRLASRDTAVSKQYSNLSENGLATKFFGTTQEFDINVGSNDPVRLSLEFNDENESKESILNRIVDAVNNSEAEVSANYIKDSPSTARITIVSNETGSTSSLSFTEVNGSNILRKLGFITAADPRPQSADTGGGFITADIADLDAKFTLNGIEITKDTNTVTDVLKDVTINLLSTQEAGSSPETLSIKHDGEGIKSEIEEFIKDYNGVIEYLNEKTSIDTVTYSRGALAGNFRYSKLKMNLRSAMSNPVSTAGDGAPKSLTNIGIKIDRTGTLKIDDSDKLQEYINNGNSDIADLFGSENGIATRANELLSNYVKTGGFVDDDKKTLSRKITNIDKRISNYEDRLRIRETTLRRQYVDLQRLLNRLNSQQALMQQTMSIYSGFSSNYAAGYW